MERHTDHASIGTVVGHWIVSTWLYQLLLAVAIGAVIGYIARKTLKAAHTRQLIDHESFLAYGLGLTFLTLGIVGVLGSDDVLACFIAGNSLTWHDFVRVETEDDSFQDGERSTSAKKSSELTLFLLSHRLYPQRLHLHLPWRLDPMERV